MTSAPVPLARPPSEQLVDLHVYLVPQEVWNEKYRSAYNDVIHQTISAGFLRVWPELSLYYLRNQIIDQLGFDVLPTEYVFLKSVGRCLTQVKSKQEFELKVKNFIPPQVPLPEIFVLEAKRDPLNLASFTNHERMDLIEEETCSTLKEEPAGSEPSEEHQAASPDRTNRQKSTRIPVPSKGNQVGSKKGTGASRLRGTEGQMGREMGSQIGKRTVPRAGQVVGNRAGRGPARKVAGSGTGGERSTVRRGQQVAGKQAGAKPLQRAPGAKTGQLRRVQAKTVKGIAETGVASAPLTDRKIRGLGSHRKEAKVMASQRGEPHSDSGQASEDPASRENRVRIRIGKVDRTEQVDGTSDSRRQSKGSFKPPVGLLHVRLRDVGVQHAPDTDRTVHSNHLPDIFMDTPLPSQSPHSAKHHHSQPLHTSHQHLATNINSIHDVPDHVVHVDHPSDNNTPQSPSVLPLITHRSSQTDPMPDLITANSRMSSGSRKASPQNSNSSPTRVVPHTAAITNSSSTSPPHQTASPRPLHRRVFASPQKSPPSQASHGHSQPTPLPPHLTQLPDSDSSPNSSTNNSAGSSGRISTIILPPEPLPSTNPTLNPLVSNQHSNQQVDNVASPVISNPNAPSIDVSPSPANNPTNPLESPGSGRWAVPQTHRSFHNEHSSSTRDTTPTPSHIPNVTPGGVPPLNLQHLESVKGVDQSTPLKSGRPDTYTNHTNEDSGIAELTPDRNEPEYGRQRSDSLERKQREEKRQTPRTVAIESRERPESLDHRLRPTEQTQPDKVHKQHLEDSTRQQSSRAAAHEIEERRRWEEQERRQREEQDQRQKEEQERRQREEQERQREERERQMEEEAAREQELKERQLELERQREMERWEEAKNQEEERQRLLKVRQEELERRRQEEAAAQEAAAQEVARQQRLRDEEEEREMEEEIRRRQADELRQSRQMSWDQARQRELDGFTPQSHRTASNQQKDPYEAFARDSVRREHTGDSSNRKLGGGRSTRHSERTQDDGAVLAEETGASVAADEDSGSARATSEKARQRKESTREKYEILENELRERQQRRYELERMREELMRQAKTLQSRTNDRRNKARDVWKKKYFEEKKKTNPLEEQVNRLRGQLDQQHRKLLNQLEGRGPNRKGVPPAPPSKKNDHKILIFKMRHQIEDLKRRVENAKMKLTSEIKLRNQAETELRNLRTDVLQRKINVTVSRSQQLNPLKEAEEKQGAQMAAMRGTGASSFTPRGTVRAGLK